MNEVKIIPIGTIQNENNETAILLAPACRAGLKGLSGYSHVQVIRWMDRCDNRADRKNLVEKKPYVKGPEELGVFATRSPARPNPIAVSTADIAYVDEDPGRIGLYYIDAFPGSPVLDLKPYIPSIDRVEHVTTPEWCRHWPESYEQSGDFDWAAEFNF